MCILRPLTDGVYYPLLSKDELAEDRENVMESPCLPKLSESLHGQVELDIF